MKNPGNLLALLKDYARHDSILAEHLSTPRQKNATYISPRTQNEVIKIMGDMVLADLLSEVREAKFLVVMADEVSSHCREWLPLCVQFIDQKCQIQEEFLSLILLERVTGEAIADAIINKLEEIQLDIANLRGQTYNGASNMSSAVVGVQARIKNLSPLAHYTHCSSHCLNLVVTGPFSFPVVRNMMDQLKA